LALGRYPPRARGRPKSHPNSLARDKLTLVESTPSILDGHITLKCENAKSLFSTWPRDGNFMHIAATQAEAGWLAHFQLSLLVPVLSPSTLPGAASLHPPTIHAKQSGYGFCRDLKGDPVGRFATTLGSHAHTRRLNFCRT
jgi:hypothetical protein